ncbi:MAG: hypothetical protein KDD27_24405 [Saprospiraceae bacterium]|nr:hypothetical protein [Saprospiraceae bacterium]
MPVWLSVVLEIIKISVPALIVFFTVYYLLKTYLDKQYQLQTLEFRQKQQNTTIPLRLQAYERLSLFCERISIPNLVLRLREEGQTAAGLRLAMLLTIQQEFEYNVTQQVYVSNQLWQIIKVSRDHTVSVINGIAEEVDPKSPSKKLVTSLLEHADKEEATSLDKALVAIKKEASALM